MGRPLVDLTGKVFGYYTVVRRHSAYAVQPVMWLCRCKCGTEKLVRGALLTGAKAGGTGCSRCVRAARAGNPPSAKFGRAWGTLEQRFEARVVKNPQDPDACWWWRGGTSGGRGVIHVHDGGEKKVSRAYVVSYLLHKGPIPSGEQVRHLCNNPICANPRHLELGGAKENWQDSVEAGTYVIGRQGEEHPGSRLTDAEVLAILADQRSYTEIAAAYNVSSSWVSMVKQRKSRTNVAGPVATRKHGSEKGAQHHRAKLTEAEAQAIIDDPRLDRRGGATEIAREFGMSVGNVYNIRMGLSWGHLKRGT